MAVCTQIRLAVNKVLKKGSVRLYLFQVHSLDRGGSSVGCHFDRRCFVAFESALSLERYITTVHELGREWKSSWEKATKRCRESDPQQYFEDDQYKLRRVSSDSGIS